MYSDENKSSLLAKKLNTFDYVIIDTCSLMDEAFPEWMDILRNAKTYRKKELEIIVPRRCYEELKRHARQKELDSKRIDAKRGLKILRHAKWNRLLKVTKKDQNENFADNVIFVKASVDRLKYKILIITQDKKLASDLLALNSLKSQNGHDLEVCKLIEGGKLSPNKGEINSGKEHKGHASSAPSPKKDAKPATPSNVEVVLANDARLSAVINNSTYPAEKKKADALAQIKALEKINESTRNQLSLLVPITRLKELANPPKVQPEKKKKEAVSAPKKDAEPTQKEAKPIETPTKLWYGVGKTIHEGFLDCGNHYGIAFHEPTVTYFQDAHGPLDLTTKDLEAIEAQSLPLMKGEEKSTLVYRGIGLAVQRVGVNFRCWIDVNHLPKKLAPIIEENKAPVVKIEEVKSPEAKPLSEAKGKASKKGAKPVPEAKEEKVEAPAEAKPEAKKATKASKAKKADAAKAEDAPAQAEAPAPEAKQPKKRAKKASAPAEPIEAEPKQEEKQAPEKPKKKASKKAEEPKAEVNEKPAEIPAEEKAEKPAEIVKSTAKSKAKAKKAVEEKPHSPAYEKALASDKRLRAVLPNPKYGHQDKVNDLLAQRELIAALSEEEAKTLKFGLSQIEDWLKANAQE